MDRRVTDPGLCRACRHTRRIHGKGGSVFWLCKAHLFDPSMPKYPALPVKQCRHFNPILRRSGQEKPVDPGA
jgi:hypothetical protein